MAVRWRWYAGGTAALVIFAVAGVLAMLAFGWSGSTVVGSLSFCSASDRDLVDCVRKWVDPFAAIFTILAIVYAAQQVYQANRQSDAAVRGSLVHLHDDLQREAEELSQIRASYPVLLLSKYPYPASGEETFEPNERDVADFCSYLLQRPTVPEQFEKRSGRRHIVERLRRPQLLMHGGAQQFFGSLIGHVLFVEANADQGERFAQIAPGWVRFVKEFQDYIAAFDHYVDLLKEEISIIADHISEIDHAILLEYRRQSDKRRMDREKKVREILTRMTT